MSTRKGAIRGVAKFLREELQGLPCVIGRGILHWMCLLSVPSSCHDGPHCSNRDDRVLRYAASAIVARPCYSLQLPAALRQRGEFSGYGTIDGGSVGVPLALMSK